MLNDRIGVFKIFHTRASEEQPQNRGCLNTEAGSLVAWAASPLIAHAWDPQLRKASAKIQFPHLNSGAH